MAISVFVTGGAGYIGSHMVKMLQREGCEVTVFDNLSTGHRDAVDNSIMLVEGDLRNAGDITRALQARKYDVVMHFAASCYVGESMQDPGKYWSNNVMGTLNLLEAMRGAHVYRLVFSSSCSTYGNPASIPMTEQHPQLPVNIYGMTKYVAERAMADYGNAYGMRTVALRYFNAAGSDPDGTLGERHDPETHLIPLVLGEALRVQRGGDPAATTLEVFGTDFDTPDGTCIRDYVHVSDLCEGHLLAMRTLLKPEGSGFTAFNLGMGRGHSVLEVINTCRRITGVDIRYRKGGRRAGDPPRLVAGAERARSELGWTPGYMDLAGMVDTAWRWYSRATR